MKAARGGGRDGISLGIGAALAALALFVDAAYLRLIFGQNSASQPPGGRPEGDFADPRVQFVVLYVLMLAAAALLGGVLRPQAAGAGAAALAAGGLLALGFVAVFSIGFSLLPMGAAAIWLTARRAAGGVHPPWVIPAGVAMALIVLVLGLALTAY